MSIEHDPARQDGAVKGGGLLDDYLSPAECAAELDINPRTLERWHRLREGPPRTIVGRKIFYHRESLRRWLHSCEQVMEV